jgi:hypothetical protein
MTRRVVICDDNHRPKLANFRVCVILEDADEEGWFEEGGRQIFFSGPNARTIRMNQSSIILSLPAASQRCPLFGCPQLFAVETALETVFTKMARTSSAIYPS